MGKGRTYELDLVRDVNVLIDQRFVWATLPDYSGVAADTFCDMAIICGVNYHGHVRGAFVEVKKRSGDEGNRVIVMSGSSEREDGSMESGLEELERLIEGCPRWGDPYVAIKFDHREIVVIHAEYLYDVLTGEVEDEDYRKPTLSDYEAEEETHGARLTASDSISMVKPTLDGWESSTAGHDDAEKILEQVGLEDNHYE